MKVLNYQDKEVVKILNDGFLLALPTETVYGLGVRWDSKKGYENLCLAKRRNPEKPIAVMCSKDFDLDKYFYINDNIRRVIDAFLPGPLTILVKAKENTPFQTHLGTFIAGIRIPDKKELLDFLTDIKIPLQVTSANISGEKATGNYDEVVSTFKDCPLVKGIIKGSCDSSIPTTVVDLTSSNPIIIREGQITLEAIEKVFKGE